jgi:hypothetical protein
MVLLQNLWAIREEKKLLAKREERIKEDVKNLMQNEKAIQAGNLICLRSEKSRKDIDKKKLMLILDDEQIEEITKETTYEVLEIKDAA